jgi:F0F1-type ATP synthase assembly protein I
MADVLASQRRYTRYRQHILKGIAPMNNQPEQHKPPQRRMIYGIAFASAIIFGTWLGIVIGFGPLGIILTIIVGIWIGVFNRDTIKQTSEDKQRDT